MKRRSHPSPPGSSGSNITTVPGDLRATPTGTAEYAKRFASRFAADYFRRTAPPSLGGLTVSSLGIGTYLGETTDEDDAAYEAAVRFGIDAGINLIDTAINYRCQRSERAIGAAIQQVIASGTARRQELVVCSKGGYIPLDRVPPTTRDDYQTYVKREFIDQEILRPDEIVAGGHSLAPRFIRWCLAKSRQNLGLRTIDIYYLHNPAQQAGIVSPDDLRDRIQAAFAVLEEAAARGEIGVYGCATWGGLRHPPGTKEHLSLEELVAGARAIAGDRHHFRVVQLPINLAMPEAVREPTQSLRGKLVTVVEAAEELGLSVVASASLMQARLTAGLPDTLRDHFPGCSTDAQRAISFVRAIPSVTSALVGMKRPEHVTENLGAARG